MGNRILKERYFTESSIATVSRELVSGLELLNISLFKKNELSNSALLILDMQDYFLDPASHAFVSSAPAIVSGLKNLTEIFYKQKLPVIFTKHINTPEDAGLMKVKWKDIITEDNPLCYINNEFDTSRAFLITKSQYDAFYSTELENILKTNNVDTLIICGLLTHLCCETTARSAFIRGFNVIFPADGTASYNIKFHSGTLYNLSHGFAAITKISDLIEIFTQK